MVFPSKQNVKSLNNMFVILIPKRTTSSMLNDYRLISFVGTLYKLIAKILANRTRTLLDLISFNQTAFLKGRQISDNICLAKGTSHKAMVLIDFSKVFNTVRWDTIDMMLEMLGFNDLFCDMINICVLTT